ncbi:hypothetical protein CUR21_02245 [Pseudorhodobacter sp. MZDSW-24AT]|nr:hypothetical protein CUR21_02245 [Pseudorhodobacter sp. MZDSW-24AT]
MAVNPLLKKLVEQSAAKYPQRKRDHYLPRVSVLDKLADHDRAAVLEIHQRQIADEIDGIKSGYISVDRKGKAHYLRLANARMRHLTKVAQSYGYWQDDAA